jgi:hypothetical protein
MRAYLAERCSSWLCRIRINKLVEAIQNVARRRKKFIGSLVEGSIKNLYLNSIYTNFRPPLVFFRHYKEMIYAFFGIIFVTRDMGPGLDLFPELKI